MAYKWGLLATRMILQAGDGIHHISPCAKRKIITLMSFGQQIEQAQSSQSSESSTKLSIASPSDWYINDYESTAVQPGKGSGKAMRFDQWQAHRCVASKQLFNQADNSMPASWWAKTWWSSWPWWISSTPPRCFHIWGVPSGQRCSPAPNGYAKILTKQDLDKLRGPPQ